MDRGKKGQCLQFNCKTVIIVRKELSVLLTVVKDKKGVYVFSHKAVFVDIEKSKICVCGQKAVPVDKGQS